MPVATASVPRITPDDTARTRRSDPITSHEAADGNDPAASRRFVMLLAIEHGKPMTDHQLEQLGAGVFSPSRLRTARDELMKAKHGALLRWTGDRGPSATRPTGAQVWEVAR